MIRSSDVYPVEGKSKREREVASRRKGEELGMKIRVGSPHQRMSVL